MRWLTTLFLIVLLVLALGWFWKGDELAPQLGLARPEVSSSSTARTVLTQQLIADKIQKIELLIPGQESLTLIKRADGQWTQPGNWPVRQQEARSLAEALSSFSPRFLPIRLEGMNADLKLYGLDDSQKPLKIKVETPGRTLTLVLGRPEAKPNESTFEQPTYLRIDDLAEVVRLGSGVQARLARSAEDFRRKQLFHDAERVRVTGGEPPPNPANPTPPATGPVTLMGDKYTAITLEGPDGAVVLKRVQPTPTAKPDPDKPFADATLPAVELAYSWELAEVGERDTSGKSVLKPLRDRVDPAKLRTILTGIPEIWATTFVKNKTLADTGLEKPERSITVRMADGAAIVLRIGSISHTNTKVDTPPQAPFQPPAPPKVTTEEFRYAKLDNNPLIFEIRADKIGDLFIKSDELRDSQLARFETADVNEFTVAMKGKPPVKVTRKKGNKDAERDEDKQDRWYVGEILAESSKVTELLDQLSKLEAKNAAPPMAPGLPPMPPSTEKPILDNADDKKLTELGLAKDGSTLTVVTSKRTYTFKIGKHDAEKKKLNLQMAGWPRVNIVADDVYKLIDRPALAYRGRRLFDTAEAKLTKLAVKQVDGESYDLQQSDDGKGWQLTSPITLSADDAKSTQLSSDLARLEVVEYVDDAPKPEDLDKKYGLAQPKLSLQLGFTGTGAKPGKLDIGNPVEAKSEFYARLNGTGSVFTLPKATVDSIKAGAVNLLPLQLWTVFTEKITGVEVQRAEAKENYQIRQDGTNFKLTGPFDAPVSYVNLQPLLTAVSTMKVEKYEALKADPVKYGLDKPALTLSVTYKQAKAGDAKAEEAVTQKLVIGKPTAAGAATRYAKLEGGKNPAVFVIPDQLLKDADKPALDWLDKKLLFLEPGRVSKISVVGADSKISMVKGEMGWTAEGESFPIDKPGVNSLVLMATNPTVSRIAAYGAKVNWAEFGLDKPTSTVTFQLTPEKDDKTPPASHTILIGKAVEGGTAVRIDGGPAVAVLPSSVADALARSRLDFVDRTLFAFDPTTLMNLFRRDNNNQELDLAPSATAGWDLLQPVKLKADQPLMDELSEQLSRLRFQRVVAYQPKSLGAYGLDEPTAAMTLKIGIDKPATKVLLLGKPVDPTKPEGEHFAMLDGQKDVIVGVLPAPISKRLLASPIKFRDRELARFIDIDKVVMVRGDRKATFAKIDGTWKMVEPLALEAEQADLDEMLSVLGKLRADEWAAEKPANLAPYGLDKPEVVWTLSFRGEEKLTLQVGKKVGDRVFARRANGDMIATLDPTSTSRVLGEYRKRSVWTGVDASQVDAIAISSGKTNIGLRKLGSVWVDTANTNAPIDVAKVTEMLDALAGLKAERYVVDQNADLKLYGLAPPERMIVLTTKTGAKTLQIGRYEGGSAENGVYARVDEPGRTEVFLLSKADTEKLMRDRAGLLKK